MGNEKTFAYLFVEVMKAALKQRDAGFTINVGGDVFFHGVWLCKHALEQLDLDALMELADDVEGGASFVSSFCMTVQDRRSDT